MKEVILTDSDRTMFAKCQRCCRTGVGVKVGDYYSMAYTKRQWSRSPKCENCESDMVLLYEVK